MIKIPGGIMSTQQINEIQQSTIAAKAYCDLEMAHADALLDKLDTAQQQILDIQKDVALLQTMENALDLISENMSKVRSLALKAQQGEIAQSVISTFSDEILNLMMVNMLIAEDTEFNGHFLFKDDVISMYSCADNDTTLITSKVPEICGVETGDFHAILDSLDNAARMINRQYDRVRKAMQSVMAIYHQLQSEVDTLLDT